MHLKPRQLGATLIEIMIAMLIGLFLLGGVLQIFSSSKQTYRLQDNMSRLQENGRFSMDFISRDVRMADYWGCLKAGTTDPSIFTNNLTGTPPLPPILGIAGTDNTGINGSDTLTLRSATTAIPITTAMTSASAAITVSANSGLEVNDVVLISDCSQSDLFQITDDPSSGTIEHAVSKNSSAAISKAYGSDASIYSSTTNTYTIQPGALRPDGSRLPALFRNGAELVEGIENMQILYGVDTDSSGDPGFGTPDHYVTANLVPDMNQVVSVRINLLAITPDDFVAPNPVDYAYNGTTTTPTDSRLRREFSSTIAVRNRLN